MGMIDWFPDEDGDSLLSGINIIERYNNHMNIACTMRGDVDDLNVCFRFIMKNVDDFHLSYNKDKDEYEITLDNQYKIYGYNIYKAVNNARRYVADNIGKRLPKFI